MTSPSLLLRFLLVLILLAAGIVLSGSMGVLVLGIAERRQNGEGASSLLPVALSSASLLLTGGLLVQTGVAVWQRLRRPLSAGPVRLPPLTLPSAPLLFGGWLLSLLAITLLHDTPLFQWLTVPFYLLAIGLPIYGLLRLSIGELELIRWRSWLTFSAGMTMVPLLAILLEGGIVLLVVVVTILSFLAEDPQRASLLLSLAERLQQIEITEELLAQMLSLLTNPVVLLFGMLFLAVLTPVVEEIVKSLPVWLHYPRLRSPAHGFALGALAGAGFGLVESMFSAATPDQTWGAALVVRAATSAIHILTAGLTGWGIGWWLSHGRSVLAWVGYGLAIVIHSLWNINVLLIVYAGARLVTAPDDPIGLAVVGIVGLPALVLLGLLTLGAPIVLWLLNRHLRSRSPSG